MRFAISIPQYAPGGSFDDASLRAHLARAEERGGRPKDAFFTLAELKKLPLPNRDDPRIDLEESYAALLISEFDQAATASARAFQKSNQLGARALAARTRLSASKRRSPSQ